MSDRNPYQDPVWDRFFDLLDACSEVASHEQVRADLQRAGIDMRPAYRRLQELIEATQARERLTQARSNRESLLRTLQGIAAPPVERLREKLAEFIEERFSGAGQVAHFHKLEKAATEEDLQSLLDDLQRLAALDEMKDRHGSSAE